MSAITEYRLLLSPKAYSTRRRGGAGKSGVARLALIFVVGAAAWPFLYVTMARLLRSLRLVEEIGPLLAARLLALGLVVFLGILLLSNLIAALSSFFLARDLPTLRASPVDWLSLYAARLTETLISSSWMVVLLLIPILVAYERVYAGGPFFYLLALAVLLPFLVIPAAAGSAATLLLVRVFPARRSRDILGIVAVAAIGLLFLVLRFLRPEELVNPEAYRNLVDFLAALRGPSSPWLPSQWAADVLVGFLNAGFDPFLVALLGSTAAALFVLGAALHGRLYPECFTRAQEGNENRIRHHLGWRWMEKTLQPLPMVSRELILKDIRIFFRDTTQWSQLIILGVLVVVYVYNIRVLPLRSGDMITQYLVTLVLFLNLALSGFVLAAIAARFVFPALSLEGRTLWLLGSSPITPSAVLGAKYWVGAIPLTFLALLLTVVTNVLLGVQPGLFALSLMSVVALSLMFTAQALAWGVYYPEFESENAAQIPTSVGGLLFMLGALVSLGAVIAGQVWALRGYLVSGLPGHLARGPHATELGLALALTLGLCVFAGLLPYRGAVRRLARLAG